MPPTPADDPGPDPDRDNGNGGPDAADSADRSEPDDAVGAPWHGEWQGEIVGSFGNSYLVDDGRRERVVPKTIEGQLASHTDLADLLTPDPSVGLLWFDTDPPVAVGPTRSRAIFRLAAGRNRPVICSPPGDRDLILNAALDVATNDTPAALTYLYDEYQEASVRRAVVNALQTRYHVLPPAALQIQDVGWVIEDVFVLTYYGRVYLTSTPFSDDAYRLQRDVEAMDTAVEFMALEPSDEPGEPDPEVADDATDEQRAGLTDIELPIPTRDGTGTRRVTLTSDEARFIERATWLADYREHYDDDVFWDQVERHVTVHADRGYRTTNP